MKVLKKIKLKLNWVFFYNQLTLINDRKILYIKTNL